MATHQEHQFRAPCQPPLSKTMDPASGSWLETFHMLTNHDCECQACTIAPVALDHLANRPSCGSSLS